MRLCYCFSAKRDRSRVVSPSSVVVGGEDQLRQKEMDSVRLREKERERENARVILVLRMFQVR